MGLAFRWVQYRGNSHRVQVVVTVENHGVRAAFSCEASVPAFYSEKWSEPHSPRRNAVASVPFRLLLGQALSVGGSFEGILWLCQLYPNVRNLFVFNKELMIRGGEFGQGTFWPVPLFSPWVPAPPAGETARERERPDGSPGQRAPAGRPAKQSIKKGFPGALRPAGTPTRIRKGPSGNPLGDSTGRSSKQLNAAARYSPTPSRVQYHRRSQALASGFGKGPGVSPGP